MHMRKTFLLSLLVLFGTVTGWAQDSGKDKGLKQLNYETITDGANVAFQSVSTTNPLNWFQGAVPAADFGSIAVFVVESTGETAADGKTLYTLRQKAVEEASAYLQAPATGGDNVTGAATVILAMGAGKNAAKAILKMFEGK